MTPNDTQAQFMLALFVRQRLKTTHSLSQPGFSHLHFDFAKLISKTHSEKFVPRELIINTHCGEMLAALDKLLFMIICMCEFCLGIMFQLLEQFS
jgi:hypothetical protein